MTERDLDMVMAIEIESFSLPWSRDSYLSELKNKYARYIVCDYHGEIVAYGGIWTIYEEAHITNVAVAQHYRQLGLGRAIMMKLEKIAREKKAHKMSLEVRPSNIPALGMYRTLSYRVMGLRKEYYSDNREDAIVMAKHLL